MCRRWTSDNRLIFTVSPDTEDHPSRCQAPCLAYQGSPEQAHCFRQGHRQGGCWVRSHRLPSSKVLADLASHVRWNFADHVSSISLAPYEKRVIELLRNSKDKRARKLAKKRVRPSPSRSCQIPNYVLTSCPARYLRPCQEEGRRAPARHRRVPPCRSLNTPHRNQVENCYSGLGWGKKQMARHRVTGRRS